MVDNTQKTALAGKESKHNRRTDKEEQDKKGIYKKKEPNHVSGKAPDEKRRLPTLPHCIAVPSAQAGLTSLFGMGRGGTPPP